MKSLMINYQKSVAEEFGRIAPVVEKYIQNSAVDASWKTIKSVYEGKLQDLQPQIMVYGIYNAGKSTLINALIRKQSASMGDYPVTDKVDFYEWNGYKIADTPGVGAPIEHENVTNEHLKKADVVLFVMSTQGSVEYAQNYVRMRDIVDAGKRVLVVLNDKQCYEEKELKYIKAKVVKNMEQLGLDSSQYRVVVVNGRDALEAIEEDDKELWEMSHIDMLEKYINVELKKAGSSVVLGNGLLTIENELKLMQSAISSTNNSDELRDVEEFLKEVRQQKSSLRSEMKSYININASRVSKMLPNQIWAVRNDESAVNTTVNQQMELLSNNIKKHFENEISDINDLIAGKAAELIEQLEVKCEAMQTGGLLLNRSSEVEITHREATLDLEKANEILTQAKEVYEAFKNARNGVGNGSCKNALGGLAVNAGTAQLVESGLAFAAKTVLPKAWAATVGTYIPYIGPIIMGLTLINSIFGGEASKSDLEAEAAKRNAIAEQQVEAEQQARMELQQNCEMMVDDYKEGLMAQVNEFITLAFSELEKKFTEKINDAENTSNNIDNDIAILSSVQNNFALLRTKASDIT